MLDAVSVIPLISDLGPIRASLVGRLWHLTKGLGYVVFRGRFPCANPQARKEAEASGGSVPHVFYNRPNLPFPIRLTRVLVADEPHTVRNYQRAVTDDFAIAGNPRLPSSEPGSGERPYGTNQGKERGQIAQPILSVVGSFIALTAGFYLCCPLFGRSPITVVSEDG
jgi:hypothetical protein